MHHKYGTTLWEDGDLAEKLEGVELEEYSGLAKNKIK